MFNLFKKLSQEPLAVSMSGVKLGDRLLVVGCRDPKMIAAVAAKPGLSGRACAVDDSAERVAAAVQGAEREGVLIEPATTPLTELPFEDAAFDVAVVHDAIAGLDPGARARAIQEVLRVLRPGGRCLVIERTRGGVASLFGGGRRIDEHYRASGGAPRALEAEGFAAVRTLAAQEGLVFVEGVKRKM